MCIETNNTGLTDMQEILKTNEYGKDTYNFEANNTTYTVIAEDDGAYCVFSRRNTLRNYTIKMYNNLEELSQRSKTFAAFAVLIAN